MKKVKIARRKSTKVALVAVLLIVLLGISAYVVNKFINSRNNQNQSIEVISEEESAKNAVKNAENDDQKAIRLLNLANLEFKQAKYNDAEKNLLIVIDIQGTTEQIRQTARGGLIQIYALQGEFEKAINMANQYKQNINKAITDETLIAAENKYIESVLTQLSQDKVPASSTNGVEGGD